MKTLALLLALTLTGCVTLSFDVPKLGTVGVGLGRDGVTLDLPHPPARVIHLALPQK